jgi:hypothetical protein
MKDDYGEEVKPDPPRKPKHSSGSSAVRGCRREGNVVLAWTTECYLALDCDMKREEEVVNFAEEYSKVQSLGNSLVARTSYGNGQVDLFWNKLNNYCIIFGRRLTWEEIKWHLDECYRLGIINRGFRKLRKFGYITIRVNAKNKKIPKPAIVRYFSNPHCRGARARKKDREGVKRFFEHWKRCKNVGMDGDNLD